MPELHSWKEIAEYLDVSVRTAQLWEKDRGLPVRRLPGGRGRVLALTNEIEDWKRSAAAPPEPEPQPKNAPALAPPAPGRPRIRWALAAAGLSLVAVAAAAVVLNRTPDLAEIQADGETLVARDRNGRIAWRRTYPGLNQHHYNNRSEARLTWVADLDGDGEKEAILGVQTHAPHPSVFGVLCLDGRGQERWRFTPGRSVMLEGRRLEPPFVPVDLRLSPPDATGRRSVVVSSEHHMYSPTQVAVLDANGRLQGEYWHRGHLAWLALREDPDRWWIYAAGLSNGDARATAILLDPARLRKEPEVVTDLPSTTAVGRLLLGKTCLNQAKSLYNKVLRIVVEPNGVTLSTDEFPSRRMVAAPTVTWRVDPQLRPLWVAAEDGYVGWVRDYADQVPGKCRGEDIPKLIDQAVLIR